MDYLTEIEAFLRVLDEHAEARDAADNGKPHWQDQTNDFNLRLAFSRVGTSACEARESLANLVEQHKAANATVTNLAELLKAVLADYDVLGRPAPQTLDRINATLEEMK